MLDKVKTENGDADAVQGVNTSQLHEKRETFSYFCKDKYYLAFI